MDGTKSDVHATLTIAGKVVNLNIGSHIIGNSAAIGCKQDVLLDDPSVDVKHAVLDISQNAVKLMDLFSVHGTYVDGRKAKKFETIELQKNAKLQFGSVQCQFRPNYESDSGFLGISNSSIRDTSIIPNSPIENDSKRSYRNKQSITSTPTVLVVQSHSLSNNDDGEHEDNSILVKATQNDPGDENMFGNITDISLQRNVFEEDDDFFIPETQEIVTKRSNDSNESFFQLNTQEFRGETNESSNDSDNLIANVTYNDSMHIPYIAPPPEGECKNDEKMQDMPVGIDVGAENDDDTDCEEEMSLLKWNETARLDNSNADKTKSASVTPDLDLDIRGKELCDELYLAPTQVFILPKPNCDEGTSKASKDEKSVENDAISNSQLEPTQAFILPKKVFNCKTASSGESVTSSNFANNNSNLEPAQVFNFKVPFQPVPITPTVAELDIDLADTQLFEPIRNNQLDNSNADKTKSASVTPDMDLDIRGKELCDELYVAPTQVFILPKPNCDEGTSKASKDEKSVENDAISNSQLEPTQAFILPKKVFNCKTASSGESVTSSNFANNNSNLELDLADTQVFEPIRNNQKISPVKSSIDKNNVDDELDSTQVFVFTKPSIPREASKSPILLDSDEEDDNSEFYLQPTLLASDIASSTKKSIESPNKTKSKMLHNKLFGSSDEEEEENSQPKATPPIAMRLVGGVEPTPDFAFIKLPNINKIGVADDLFQKTTKPFLKTLLQESSDEDDERHDPSEQMNRLLNESKTAGTVTIKPTRSKRLACKVSTFSEEMEKASQSSKEKSKKETVKAIKKASEKSKSSVTRKTPRVNGKTKSDKTSDDTKTANTGIQLPTRVSSRNKCVPDQQKEHQQQQNESAEKLVKSETVEKSATKRQQCSSTDDSGMAKKRSKENVPTISDTHLSVESSVTPIRKMTRQKHRIVFTKMDSKPYENLIEKIDGCVVENPANCTVLITDTIYRTWKFLAAMAKGIPIVSIEWLQVAATSRGSVPDYDDYLINDLGAERRFKFSLKKSLGRARKSPLFKGYTFHCTPNTKPTPKEICDIVECAGARVIKRIPSNFKKPEQFYVVSDEMDMDSWPHLQDKIHSLTIIRTEAILTAVTQQCVNFKPHLLTK